MIDLKKTIYLTFRGGNSYSFHYYLFVPCVMGKEVREDSGERVPSTLGKHVRVFRINKQTLHSGKIQNDLSIEQSFEAEILAEELSRREGNDPADQETIHFVDREGFGVEDKIELRPVLRAHVGE